MNHDESRAGDLSSWTIWAWICSTQVGLGGQPVVPTSDQQSLIFFVTKDMEKLVEKDDSASQSVVEATLGNNPDLVRRFILCGNKQPLNIWECMDESPPTCVQTTVCFWYLKIRKNIGLDGRAGDRTPEPAMSCRLWIGNVKVKPEIHLLDWSEDTPPDPPDPPQKKTSYFLTVFQQAIHVLPGEC